MLAGLPFAGRFIPKSIATPKTEARGQVVRGDRLSVSFSATGSQFPVIEIGTDFEGREWEIIAPYDPAKEKQTLFLAPEEMTIKSIRYATASAAPGCMIQVTTTPLRTDKYSA